jgi:hypothetical protein
LLEHALLRGLPVCDRSGQVSEARDGSEPEPEP